MAKPVVALVGRPNVGKSTLFNRLAGERLAVVDDLPGTTRDRLVSEALWNGVAFDIVDTGGIDPRVRRGREALSTGSSDYVEAIRAQADIASAEADAILFLVDARDGPTAADQEVADRLRRLDPPPPIFLVVNKSDSSGGRARAVEFYELGMGDPYPVSAVHGSGVGDLLDRLVEALGREPTPVDDEEETGLPIAIVGRPNVGKSSLLNRLLGEERGIVSPIPGT